MICGDGGFGLGMRWLCYFEWSDERQASFLCCESFFAFNVDMLLWVLKALLEMESRSQSMNLWREMNLN